MLSLIGCSPPCHNTCKLSPWTGCILIKSLFKKKWSAVELGQASGWMDGEGVLTFSEDAFYLPLYTASPSHTLRHCSHLWRKKEGDFLCCCWGRALNRGKSFPLWKFFCLSFSVCVRLRERPLGNGGVWRVWECAYFCKMSQRNTIYNFCLLIQNLCWSHCNYAYKLIHNPSSINKICSKNWCFLSFAGLVLHLKPLTYDNFEICRNSCYLIQRWVIVFFGRKTYHTDNLNSSYFDQNSYKTSLPEAKERLGDDFSVNPKVSRNLFVCSSCDQS